MNNSSDWRSGLCWAKWVKEFKRYKPLNFKVNKSWGCNVQHGDLMKVAKRVDHKSTHHLLNNTENSAQYSVWEMNL